MSIALNEVVQKINGASESEQERHIKYKMLFLKPIKSKAFWQ
jgi:hypothetical protein